MTENKAVLEYKTPATILTKTLSLDRGEIKKEDMIDAFTEITGPDDLRATLFHRFCGNVLGITLAKKFGDIYSNTKIGLGRKGRQEIAAVLMALGGKKSEEIEPQGAWPSGEETEEGEGE